MDICSNLFEKKLPLLGGIPVITTFVAVFSITVGLIDEMVGNVTGSPKVKDETPLDILETFITWFALPVPEGKVKAAPLTLKVFVAGLISLLPM